MKLTSLIERFLDESEASEQAKALGLVYMGYGQYKDPKTNKVVAKTVNGRLVRKEPTTGDAQPADQPPAATGGAPTDGMENGEAPAGTPAPSAAPATAPTSGVAASAQAPNDVDEPDPNPDAEPAIAADTGLSRLLSAAGGDKNKLRKALVKKFRGGEIGVKKWLDKLDAMEAAEKQDIQAQIAGFEKTKADALAVRKAKYAEKYPSPQI